MKYKIGDKLMCKRTVGNTWFLPEDDEDVRFKAGKWYEIYDMRNSVYYMKGTENENFSWFSSRREPHFGDMERYVWDYFYTEIEMRKRKLIKLDEI